MDQDEAVNQDNLEPENELEEAQEESEAQEPDEGTDADDSEDTESGDSEDGDGQDDESDEVEIVREGDTQPQQASTPRGFLKRIGKLNSKVDKAKAETAEASERVQFLEEENKILKLAVEQQRGNVQKEPEYPNPDDFDGGAYDADYIRKLQEYQQHQIQAGIQKAIAEQNQKSTVTSSQKELAQKLERQQMDHYNRAAKLGVKDYEETEDKAIEIFGVDHTNHLIANLDNSEVAMYYFGKNPEIAQDFAEKLKTQPIKALIEMGSHLAGVKVKKGKRGSNLPDPDEELEGGKSSSNKQRGPKGATFT